MGERPRTRATPASTAASGDDRGPGPDRPRPIRVALVDRHDSTRAAIKELLADDRRFELVAEARSARAAIELIDSTSPDLLMLDLGLRDGASLTVISSLLARRPTLTIVVLTMDDEPSYRSRALAAGAAALVLKDAPPEQIVEAIVVAAPAPRLAAPNAGRRRPGTLPAS